MSIDTETATFTAAEAGTGDPRGAAAAIADPTRRHLPWDVMGSQLTDGDYPSVAAAMAALGLDYTVTRAVDQARLPDGGIVVSHNRDALVRPAPNGAPGHLHLGTVGKGYGLSQNAEAFAVFDRLRDAHGLKIIGGADYRAGTSAVLVGQLPEPVLLRRGGSEDMVNLYIYARNGFAGSSTVRFDLSTVVKSCTNALNLGALHGAIGTYSTRHTANITARLGINTDLLMDEVASYAGAFDAAAQAMIAETVSAAAVDRFLAEVFPITRPTNEVHVANVTERRIAVRSLITASPTLAGFHNTPWSLVQGVTEWADFYRPVRGDAAVARAEDAMAVVGAVPDLKAKAWSAALSTLN